MVNLSLSLFRGQEPEKLVLCDPRPVLRQNPKRFNKSRCRLAQQATRRKKKIVSEFRPPFHPETAVQTEYGMYPLDSRPGTLHAQGTVAWRRDRPKWDANELRKRGNHN